MLLVLLHVITDLYNRYKCPPHQTEPLFIEYAEIEAKIARHLMVPLRSVIPDESVPTTFAFPTQAAEIAEGEVEFAASFTHWFRHRVTDGKILFCLPPVF
jgi:hypothetical protein